MHFCEPRRQGRSRRSQSVRVDGRRAIKVPLSILKDCESRPHAGQTYRKTGKLGAVQLLLGHAKIETTMRYLGVEVDDALRLAEQIEL